MAGNRGRGRGLFAAVTLLLGTAQAGTAAAPAVHIDDPVYAAPQRLVTVAPGRRLNLYCVGHGSPTVVLEAGLGDSTIGWALVQKPIARATRVCSYDRAGLGFSDGSGEPGDAVHIAADLHALLQAAGERPPYVLVGHSAGGLYTRMYADRHPDEVVGLVLVESSHEDQWVRGWAIGEPGQQARWDAWLAQMDSCVDEARKGLAPGTPAFERCVGSADPRFSDAINAAQLAYAATVRWQTAAASERHAVAYATADQVRATRRDFGNLPLIVLTHAPYPRAKDETQALRDQRTLSWEGLHNELAAMSTRGINIVVPGAGHYVQYDRPQVVIDAVAQAVAIARRAGDAPEKDRAAPAP